MGCAIGDARLGPVTKFFMILDTQIETALGKLPVKDLPRNDVAALGNPILSRKDGSVLGNLALPHDRVTADRHLARYLDKAFLDRGLPDASFEDLIVHGGTHVLSRAHMNDRNHASGAPRPGHE